ncbi:hypothetical protein ABK040_011543 [Willaertia magna]
MDLPPLPQKRIPVDQQSSTNEDNKSERILDAKGQEEDSSIQSNLSLEASDMHLPPQLLHLWDNVKQYYKTTLLSTSIFYFVNGLLLFFGTFLGLNIYSFYGFPANNPPLQRAAGILNVVMAFINFIPRVWRKNRLLLLSAILNLFVICYYLCEGLLFGGIRIEVVIGFSIFMFVNMYYAFKEMKWRNRATNSDRVLYARQHLDNTHIH